jgi:non-ribosomal peptide synthetase component F
MDSNLNLVPHGSVGEIYLSGPQLSSGYFGAPKLTENAFISADILNGLKLYRSGDMGRLLPSREVEVLLSFFFKFFITIFLMICYYSFWVDLMDK